MKRVLSIVVVIAFAIIACSAIDFDNDKYTEDEKQQILDTYSNPDPAEACGKVISVGFTDDEKRQILDEHNRLRSFVAQGSEQRGNPGPQPPASNMQMMAWDDNIAALAQRCANQCNFRDAACRNVGRNIGQNTGMKMTTGAITTTPTDIVKMWYDQVKNMDRNLVSRLTNNIGVGQYTQLVWAKTNLLGCGKIVHQMNNWKKYYVVCDYFPSGNVMNQPIYQIKNE